ncbi:hypothetical protein GCK72_011321 [Caenorhabditis remanei]|uniref:Zinc finger C3HC4 RING-type domain-containing protein n=1 Tax=Caenorhabditis remanei TaxID=31234 RepID=A0A6A5H854_CAERE|nr:hypothetical protein GCK72_011321 [Caenorhabditis remanei]KAF1763056.1 hypothetical protein GCK72_011321 [Caenorhabditis remanei]
MNYKTPNKERTNVFDGDQRDNPRITSKTAAFLHVALTFLLYLLIGPTKYAYLLPACTVMCIISAFEIISFIRNIQDDQDMDARNQRAPEARDGPQAVEIAPQENNIEEVADAEEVNADLRINELREEIRRDIQMIQDDPRMPLEQTMIILDRIDDTWRIRQQGIVGAQNNRPVARNPVPEPDTQDVVARLPVAPEAPPTQDTQNPVRQQLSKTRVPRILKECGHSICDVCVGQLQRVDRNYFIVNCPTCRKKTFTTRSKLPKNYALIELME